MESEKVKEIKEKLQEEIFIANSFGDKLRKVPTKELENLLTLINELGSENERLKKDCADIANHYQEMGKFYFEETEKTNQLKDRIAELEKENKKLLDSVESVQNDRCVYKCELTKKHLKQFAEMLKEKAIVFFDEGEPIVLTSNIDETLIETTEGV